MLLDQYLFDATLNDLPKVEGLPNFWRSLMEKLKTLLVVSGALLGTAVTNASASCMVQAVDSTTTDKTSSQILGNASKLTSAELIRQYGSPGVLKALPNAQEQMSWTLASGDLHVVADRATGKIKTVNLVSSKAVVDSLLACAAP